MTARSVYYVAGWRDEDMWVAQIYACTDDDGNRALLTMTQATMEEKLWPMVRDLIVTVIGIEPEDFDIRLTMLPSPNDPDDHPDGTLPLFMRVGQGSERQVGTMQPSRTGLVNLLRDVAWEIENQQSTSEGEPA